MAITCVLGIGAHAQNLVKNPKALSIVLTEGAAPYTVSAKGIGLDLEILQALSERSGVLLELVFLPSERLEGAFLQGEVGAFASIRPISRGVCTQPFTYWLDGMIVRKQDKDTLRTLSDLAGLRFSTFYAGREVLAEQFLPLAKQGHYPIAVLEQNSAVRMLISGQTKAHIGDVFVFQTSWQALKDGGVLTYDDERADFHVAQIVARSPHYICTDDEDIARQLDASLTQMWADGTITKLQEKYAGSLKRSENE